MPQVKVELHNRETHTGDIQASNSRPLAVDNILPSDQESG